MSDEIVPTNRGRFLAGHPRLGGKKRGTASKARDLAESMGVDPLKWLLNLLKTGTYQAVVIDETSGKKTKKTTIASGDMLTDAAKCTLQYLYPKLSGISHTGPDGEGPVETVSLNLTAILANPELCRAAETMALLMAEQSSAQPQQIQPPIAGLLESGDGK